MAMNTLISSSRTSATAILRGVKRPIKTLQSASSLQQIKVNHHLPLNNFNNNRHTIHTSTTLYKPKSQKDLFTPSPFKRSSIINVSDKFAIYRQLKEGPDEVYGVRRYMLLPRSSIDNDENEVDDENYVPKNVIASLNANRNVLFGAQLHLNTVSSTTNQEEEEVESSNNTKDDIDDYISKYLAACGSLLDIAKEDASINGQQVQALATLNGLCSWVNECLEKDGEGSHTLMNLMHGTQPNVLKEQEENKLDDNEEGSKLPSGKRSNQKIIINNNNTETSTLILKNESQRIQMLEAIRAISTGIPRPGHSVVGAGTYRDGMKGWVALSREYTQLATTTNSDTAVTLDSSYVGRVGLEELVLYKSRNGEVTKIEHLAHTTPEYLKEAGGAMARLFFV